VIYSTILLIDDDPDDQEIFSAAIHEVSSLISCNVMDNAAIALEKLKSGQISQDMIFLDLNMPIMNGEQFLHIIKNEQDLKEIPVIIYSTSSHPDTIKRTLEIGIMDFLVKPNDYNLLISTLTKYLCN
jgi:response regulator of citrate/malate metabolism